MLLNHFRHSKKHHEPIILEIFDSDATEAAITTLALLCKTVAKNAIIFIGFNSNNQMELVVDNDFKEKINVFYLVDIAGLETIYHARAFTGETIVLLDTRFIPHGAEYREKRMIAENFIKVVHRITRTGVIVLSRDASRLSDYLLKLEKTDGDQDKLALFRFTEVYETLGDMGFFTSNNTLKQIDSIILATPIELKQKIEDITTEIKKSWQKKRY